MKKIIVVVAFFLIYGYTFCQVSLNENTEGNPSYAFLVSDEIETDKVYASLLSRYIFSCMVDEDSELNRDSVNLLIHRKSFAQAITFIILDETNKLNVFYESNDGWEAMKMNLITNIPDTNIIYQIADTLLANACNYGAMVLWDKCNIDKLSNFLQYKDSVVSSKNEYTMAELLALCCISGHMEEYASVSHFLMAIDLDLYNSICNLCENAPFTYEDLLYHVYNKP